MLGAQLRLTDPAFLHYRSGALMMARARQLPGSTPAFDALLGIVASSEDPISGGRHKVWGSRALWVPPQTCTIASHLPKATGTAFSLARARRMGVATRPAGGRDRGRLVRRREREPRHRAGGHQHRPLRGAARTAMPDPLRLRGQRDRDQRADPARLDRGELRVASHLRYLLADGEIDEVWATAAVSAIGHVRRTRQPAFLHLPTIRLWGHAGSDAEQVYRTAAEIAEVEDRDPIVRTARRLVALGAARPEELRAIVADTRDRVARGGGGDATAATHDDGRGGGAASRPRTPTVLPSALPAAT